MEPFHNSKRSSISFGSSQRQPLQGQYDYNAIDNNINLQYDSSRRSNNDGGNNNNDPYDNTINNGINSSSYYSSRSPMYSPLDYTKPMMFSQAATAAGTNFPSQLQPSRGYNIISNNGLNTNPVASCNTALRTICEWEANAPLYALDWSVDDLICLGSYKEDSRNKLQVIGSNELLTWDKIAECSMTYPVSKVQWLPGCISPRQLATGSDSLRIWSLSESSCSLQEQVNLSLCKFNKQHNRFNEPNNSNGDPAWANKILGELPPVTSFDWNPIETNILISSSIDTTCIVWDLNSTNYVKTQLIAHDSEVYDVRFLSKSTQIFASCGGDGSVRVFDLRSLAHSTIIYEPSAKSPNQGASDPTLQSNALLRLEPSPSDPNILATFVCDSNSIIIIDMRNPETPVLTLEGHSGSINQVKWHPTNRNILISCSDDCEILYWDLNKYISNGSTITSTPNGGSSNNSTSMLDSSTTTSTSDIDMTDDNDHQSSRIVDTPNFFLSNGTEEINNIVWRPEGDNWLGAVSAKKFQNIKVF